MLRLSTSFSKKVPVEGQEFSSQSYHASVELELSDALQPAEIRTRIHDTFAVVRDAVEAELNGKASADTDTPAEGTGQGKSNGGGNGNGKKISNAQAKFALDLARKNGISLNELDQMIRDEYGVPGLYDLTGGKGGQASELIDRLQAKKAA